jgi:hypothetical protein
VVVAAHLVEIAEQRPSPLFAMTAEDVDADDLADEGRGDMVRGAAEKPARELRPGRQRLAPRDQLVIARRQLPASVDAAIPAPGRAVERHPLAVLRRGLEIVERGRRGDRVPERRMRRDVADPLAVDPDFTAILERADMVRARLDVACHARPPCLVGSLSERRNVIPAKAGTHRSAVRAFEPWVPAFAGKTVLEVLSG